MKNDTDLQVEQASDGWVTGVDLTPTPVAVETTGELMPKKKYTRAKLVSANDIASELARIYRATKAGELDPNVATKLTYILSTLSKLRMDGEIERRLEILEERGY